MTPKTHHVAKFKKNLVDDIKKLVKQYSIIATVNMENMPAAQLQKMRQQLRGTVVIRMTKRRLFKIALEECKNDKKGVEKLIEHLKGMPALMFTNDNPFKLYKALEKNKTSAPAKPGQISPKDILIQAGPTPFAPGPVISELSMIGLKTGVEDGRVAIKEDKVVVKEGEVIKPNVASMLLRLGITPMEIGLDLVAAYENGTIFTKDVLGIDEKEFMNRLQNAERWAFNLGVEIGYPAKKVLEHLIGKAFNDSKALALEQNIICDAVAEELLSKAERQMLSLKDSANISTEVKKEEPKAEEKPKEEKKEEPKPEVKEEISKKESVKEEKSETIRKESIGKKKDDSIKKEEKPKEEPKKDDVPKESKPEEKVEIIKKESIEKKTIKEEPLKTKEKKEEVKKSEKPKTEDKVKKLVEKTKQKEDGKKEPSADDLLKEADESKEKKEKEKRKEEKKKDEHAVAEEVVRMIQSGKKFDRDALKRAAESAKKDK